MTAPHGADWRAQARCTQVDPEHMYPPPGNAVAVEFARAICGLCPVRDTCLADIMAAEGNAGRDSRHGVVGGLTPRQRRRLYEEQQKAAREAAGEAGDVEGARAGRPRAKCPSPSAYNRHIKYGEPVDAGCREAHNRANRAIAERRRAAA